MNVNFRVAKTMFFDRPVANGLDAAAKKVLSRFGARTRRRAKSSLRMARQKTAAEMTEEERERYAARLAIWKRDGGTRPRRPDAVSKPGEPPRLHTRPKSPLRELIYFVYDPREKAVLIGPTASNATQGKATQALEYGGASLAKRGGKREPVTVAARPFMRPAFNHELPELRKLKNTVK